MPVDIPEWGESRRGGTHLYVPFNEDFITDLKTKLPSTKRVWKPDDGAWWIHDDWLDQVESLLKEHFEDYE